MTGGSRIVSWRTAGWAGEIDLAVGATTPAALLAAVPMAERRSKHARSGAIAGSDGRWWIKHYEAPYGRRAWRAWRIGAALRRHGIEAPQGVLVGTRAGEGVLVTRDVGLPPLLAEVACLDAAASRAPKRALLRSLGRAVGRLHDMGFVHGDLVASNVHGDGVRWAFLDHDRTRRSHLLVWWHAWRNLVQLGRLVVPGIGLTDRMRVLAGYAEVRGLSRRGRHRLAARVVAKTRARRCAIDGIAPAVAARVSFGTLMRAGGPFDRTQSPSTGSAS